MGLPLVSTNPDINTGFGAKSRMLSIFLMTAILLMAAVFLSVIIPAAAPMAGENAARGRQQGEYAY